MYLYMHIFDNGGTITTSAFVEVYFDGDLKSFELKANHGNIIHLADANENSGPLKLCLVRKMDWRKDG